MVYILSLSVYHNSSLLNKICCCSVAQKIFHFLGTVSFLVLLKSRLICILRCVVF